MGMQLDAEQGDKLDDAADVKSLRFLGINVGTGSMTASSSIWSEHDIINDKRRFRVGGVGDAVTSDETTDDWSMTGGLLPE